MTDATDTRHRRIILTPRMHAVLLDVLEFACAEHPGDVDARRLRNIAKAAKRIAPSAAADVDTLPREGVVLAVADSTRHLLAELRKLEEVGPCAP